MARLVTSCLGSIEFSRNKNYRWVREQIRLGELGVYLPDSQAALCSRLIRPV